MKVLPSPVIGLPSYPTFHFKTVLKHLIITTPDKINTLFVLMRIMVLYGFIIQIIKRNHI